MVLKEANIHFPCKTSHPCHNRTLFSVHSAVNGAAGSKMHVDIQCVKSSTAPFKTFTFL